MSEWYFLTHRYKQSICKALETAKLRSCPKQLSHSHSIDVKAATKSLPLSVADDVIQLIEVFQLVSTSLKSLPCMIVKQRNCIQAKRLETAIRINDSGGFRGGAERVEAPPSHATFGNHRKYKLCYNNTLNLSLSVISILEYKTTCRLHPSHPWSDIYASLGSSSHKSYI